MHQPSLRQKAGKMNHEPPQPPVFASLAPDQLPPKRGHLLQDPAVRTLQKVTKKRIVQSSGQKLSLKNISYIHDYLCVFIYIYMYID